MKQDKLFLTGSEIVELTGFVHVSKQNEFLSEIGIPYIVRRDDRLVVLREAVQKLLGGDGSKPGGRSKQRPNFDL